MPISYLRDHPWVHWSREERLYCAALYEHARADVTDFARWLCRETDPRIEIATDDVEWDLGFEVCFYRDYLWQLKRSARAEGYSPKRTFDLALFSERAVIIIEAKVCEDFNPEQNDDFARDRAALSGLLKRPDLDVKIVALASSKYFENGAVYGHPATLSLFDGKLTWRRVAAKYPDPLLLQADSMYNLQPGVLLG
jgi:hypothetical protein